MLGHRKSRGVVAYASQMLTSATPENSPSFADVEMGASAAGETIQRDFVSWFHVCNLHHNSYPPSIAEVYKAFYFH